jgi:DNA repair exonuclease SbcCD ATPase subunit
MNQIKALHLKDVGPLENIKLKIKPGVSVIYGLNRASGKSSKNSNAVGKSLCFSTISDILYDEPIVGEKQDRLRSGTRILGYLDSKGRKIVVKRQAKGKKDTLRIKVNGEEKKLRTSSFAKEYLKKLWPITQEEYNTYVHIDSRIPHPLVMGSSAERKAFFTSFFNLDIFDNERKLYVAELNKLQRIKAAYNELRHEYLKQKENLLSEEVFKSTKKRIKFLKNKLETLQEKFLSIQETLTLLQFAESAKDQINALNRFCHQHINTEEFERIEKDTQWELKKVENDLNDAEAWEQYQRDNSYYSECYEQLSDKTKYLLDKSDADILRQKARIRAEQNNKLESEIKQLKIRISFLNQQIDIPKPEKVEFPNEDLIDLETLKKAYSHRIQHSEKFKKGTCETCGQIVKITDINVLQTKLKKILRKIQQYNKASEYQEFIKQHKKYKKELDDISEQYDEKLFKYKKYRFWTKVHQELINLPNKPKPFKGKKLQVKVLKLMYKELLDKESLLKYVKPHLQTIIDFSKLTKEDIEKTQKSSSLSLVINTITNKLAKLQAKLQLHSSIEEQLLDMRSRLIKMKKQLKDEEALIYLVKGYQDKNIKKKAIQAISHDLMKKVNIYARKIFPEDYRFELIWDTQISLLVHRKHGKKILTSDVRKLSGAESVFFTLILVCALLAYVPSHKRCSIMILDEPSARLNKETVLILQDIISILNTLIPSIIIITPNSEELYPNSHNYTIIKQNGISTLVEDHPCNIKGR